MGIRDEEKSGILETEYLLSIPEMKERLDQGVEVTVEDCEDFDWGVPIEGAVWGTDVGVSAIDFFTQLSGVLTPKSNALFDFLAKSVMYNENDDIADRKPLNIDYTTTCISAEALENKAMVSSRNRIVDSFDAEDLGAVSMCFQGEFTRADSMGLNFYSTSYKPEFNFWEEKYRFNDEYRYHYHIDFKTRTFELYCRPE